MIEHRPEFPPPIMGTWNRLYAVVIGSLVLCIILFRLFSRMYS